MTVAITVTATLLTVAFTVTATLLTVAFTVTATLLTVATTVNHSELQSGFSQLRYFSRGGYIFEIKKSDYNLLQSGLFNFFLKLTF